MKCPKCKGMGILIDGIGGKAITCQKCNGSGKEQTNEEWIHSLNTEQLAELIALICGSNILSVWRIVYHCADSDVDAVKMWLKQPHTTIKE